jgi:hypothetical protein
MDGVHGRPEPGRQVRMPGDGEQPTKCQSQPPHRTLHGQDTIGPRRRRPMQPSEERTDRSPRRDLDVLRQRLDTRPDRPPDRRLRGRRRPVGWHLGQWQGSGHQRREHALPELRFTGQLQPGRKITCRASEGMHLDHDMSGPSDPGPGERPHQLGMTRASRALAGGQFPGRKECLLTGLRLTGLRLTGLRLTGTRPGMNHGERLSGTFSRQRNR